jgi:hypothetical protein
MLRIDQNEAEQEYSQGMRMRVVRLTIKHGDANHIDVLGKLLLHPYLRIKLKTLRVFWEFSTKA